MKLSTIARTTMLATLLVGSMLGVGRADERTTDDRPHHRRPPQAAFDACQSKAAGDSCQVTLRDRTLSGTCAATPAGTSEGALACRPDHPPGPPPELSQACAGKADGDACTVTRGDRSDAGVCRKGRSGTLICLP